MGFAEADLTCDAMLGGSVRLHQPRSGYRAGTDPVLLAAAVPAKPGDSVLELGCGAAPGLCCLGARVPGLALAGIELQPAYAALARKNLAANALDGRVWTADLQAPPPDLRALNFTHVMANPPYFEADRRIAAQEADREIALAGPTPLEAWVITAAKRLKPRGTATFIQRAERLPELIASVQRHLGSLELLPLIPRENRAPRLVLLRARKDGRAPFRFHPAAVIHAGARHEEPGNRYTSRFEAIMMRGQPLIFGALKS